MKAKRAQPLQFFENLPANVALPLPSYPLARRIYTWTAYQDGERCSMYIPFCSGFVRSSPANAIFLESMNPREFWANEGNVSTINFIKFWKKCTKLRIYNCWKRCGTSEWVLKKSRLTMRFDKSEIQSGKVWKVKSYAPREKNMAAGRNETKKKKDVALTLKREVTAICRHFFIRDILQPLKVCEGSGIFRAMAALSTDVRKNDKSLKFPGFDIFLNACFFF